MGTNLCTQVVSGDSAPAGPATTAQAPRLQEQSSLGQSGQIDKQCHAQLMPTPLSRPLLPTKVSSQCDQHSPVLPSSVAPSSALARKFVQQLPSQMLGGPSPDPALVPQHLALPRLRARSGHTHNQTTRPIPNHVLEGQAPMLTPFLLRP